MKRRSIQKRYKDEEKIKMKKVAKTFLRRYFLSLKCFILGIGTESKIKEGLL